MPNPLHITALSPEHFSDILSWDRPARQSFFSFMHPLKISNDHLGNLLSSKKHDVKALVSDSKKVQAVCALSQMSLGSQTAYFSFCAKPETDFRELHADMTVYFERLWKTLNLRKVTLMALEEDSLSMQLMRHMKAHEEGRLSQVFFQSKKYWDIVYFSVFQKEFY